MDSAIAGLIGAIIGAFVVIINTLIANNSQIRLEQIRNKQAKQAKIEEELRSHIAQAAHYILTAQHSMEWICWHAHHNPKSLNSDLIVNYHKEIHDIFPKILGTLAVISSIDATIYLKITTLTEVLYGIDGKIARALINYQDDPVQAATDVASIHPLVYDLYQSLPEELANIMQIGGFTKRT